MKMSVKLASRGGVIALGAVIAATSMPATAQKYQKVVPVQQAQPVQATRVAAPPRPAPVRAAINTSEITTVSGSLGYRERMLPPPGSVAIVSLQDISRADAPAQVLASQQYAVGGHGVPFGYQLEVPTSSFQPGHRYAVRGEIRDQNGNLLWTTDRVQMIDTSQAYQVLPTQMMVKTGSRGGSASEMTADNALVGAPWRVEYIDGQGVIDNSKTTIQFAPDGTVFGTTGCNQYSGQYTMNGDMLSFGPLRVTRRACVPALSDQEARFTSAMDKVNRYRIDDRGGLVLYTNDGRSIVSTQYVAAQPY